MLLIGCIEGERSSGKRPGEITRLSLEITPNPTQAGEASTIRCLAWDVWDEQVEVSTHVTVTAPSSARLSFSAHRYVAQRVPASGSYGVQCEIPGEATKVQGHWFVTPGPAARVQLAVSPRVVRSGQALQVTTTIRDAFGNAATPELEWQVLEEGFEIRPPESGALRIIGSGWATLRAMVPESEIFSEVQVGVDQRPPVVHIEQPLRASFVLGDDPVQLRGFVEDDVGVAFLWINGQALALDSAGRFASKLMKPRLGVNVLASEAVDLADRDTEAAQAFLYGEFGAAGEWRPKALRLGLTPSFLDDDEPDLDDAAGIAEQLLQSEDLAPSRVDFGGCGGGADLRNLRHGRPQIDLWPRTGGIGANVTIGDVSLDYSGDVCLEACLPIVGCACPCTGFSGTAHADGITASVDTDLEAAECRVVIGARPASASVHGLDLRLSGLGGLLNPVLDLFESSVRRDMEAAIRDAVDDVLEETLSGLLDGLRLPDELGLPAPFDGRLPVESCFTQTEFDDEGGHIDAQVRFPVSTKGVLPPGAGSLQTPGAPPSFRGDHALGLGFNDDLINGLFFAAWRSGQLDEIPLDVDTEEGAFPVPLDSLTLQALLPPVLMPWQPRGDSSGLALGLGDLLLEADGPLGEILVAVSMIVPVSVSADEGSISLQPVVEAELVELELEILSAPEIAGLEPLLNALESLMRASLLPELLEDPIRIDLPRIDLGLRNAEGQAQDLVLVDIEARVDGEAKDHLSVRGQLEARP